MSSPPAREGPAGDAAGRVPPYLRAQLPAPPADRPDRPARASGDDHGVRPFVLTAGRVSGDAADIGLETQVTVRPAGPGGPHVPVASLASELRAIVALCDKPVSVAEISARSRLHLEVTKILVGDLWAAGYLDVHTDDLSEFPTPETILRVMHGLRAIS
jgi:hypothetical protein